MGAGVHARAERTCHSEMSQWKSQIEGMTRDVSDVTHWKCGLRFEKSQWVEIETWARPDEFVLFGRRTWWGGGRWKSQYRKIVPLSPYVEKPFNSKVIKSFVHELRSRKCFLCFGIPMLSMYVMDIMNVLRNMYISHNHVGLCYMNSWK